MTTFQISGSILYVMEIAVILALGLRDWIDFGVIVRIRNEGWRNALILTCPS